MTAKGFFITGTDTDVGKTYISVKLIKRLKEQGNTVLGVKPICSEEGDVIALKEASGVDCDNRVINPVNYSGQVAPHLKVNQKVPLTAAELLQKCQKTPSQPYDYFIVEGCGGF